MSSVGLQKQTLSQQVADTIRSRILSGFYSAGTQLRQGHIADELGVSRIPVREALHQLHSEGFITLVSHKGAVVSELSLEEILELYELRVRIETWLLSWSIQNMTSEDLDRAAEANEKFSNPENGIYNHELNWAFHACLYAPSKRMASIEILANIHEKIERYSKLMVAIDSETLIKTADDHGRLIQLCREKDVLRAVELLDSHISSGAKQLATRLAELQGNQS